MNTNKKILILGLGVLIVASSALGLGLFVKTTYYNQPKIPIISKREFVIGLRYDSKIKCVTKLNQKTFLGVQKHSGNGAPPVSQFNAKKIARKFLKKQFKQTNFPNSSADYIVYLMPYDVSQGDYFWIVKYEDEEKSLSVVVLMNGKVVDPEIN